MESVAYHKKIMTHYFQILATNLNLQNSIKDRQGVNGQLIMTETNKNKTSWQKILQT